MRGSGTLVFRGTNSAAATMTNADWDRQFNGTASTVDNRVHVYRPLVSYVSYAKPHTREKNYWMPKFERLKKHR